MKTDPAQKTDAAARRLFLVTYDYVESGGTHRCGFLCEATTVREAAEAFWNQHPGEEFHLRSVTDGSMDVFWLEQSGQFVTVPQREEELPVVPTHAAFLEAQRFLNADGLSATHTIYTPQDHTPHAQTQL